MVRFIRQESLSVVVPETLGEVVVPRLERYMHLEHPFNICLFVETVTVCCRAAGKQVLSRELAEVEDVVGAWLYWFRFRFRFLLLVLFCFMVRVRFIVTVAFRAEIQHSFRRLRLDLLFDFQFDVQISCSGLLLFFSLVIY
jgi:hypothetical protein